MTKDEQPVGLEKGSPGLLAVVLSHFYPVLVIQLIYSIKMICSKRLMS